VHRWERCEPGQQRQQQQQQRRRRLVVLLLAWRLVIAVVGILKSGAAACVALLCSRAWGIVTLARCVFAPMHMGQVPASEG
jgi:hypothetical protein